MAQKSVGKYDVRAPPRRRQKGSDIDEQPVFLRKAYEMISTCPAEYGGWSESGDTVIIKDAKAFSEKVIPTAYKHNNFSSFVRQLNFYGFRKVKSNVLQNNDWWEFRHPHFIRGQPHLLSEIKRSVHFESNGGDVSDLKNQVTDLNDRIAKLSEIVEDLTEKVGTMSLSPAPVFKVKEEPEEPRRKVRARVEAPSLSNPLDVPNFADVFDAQEGVEMFSSDDVMMDGVWEELIQLDSPVPSCAAPLAAQQDNPAMPAPSQEPSSLTAQDLTTVLTALTPDLQTRFVDKLAEAMGAQLAAALTSQVCNVVSDTKDSGLVLPSGNAPEIALPLASAALGAFVMSSLQSLGLGGGQQVAAKKIATISA
eukprot:gene2245-2459_t